MNPDTWIDVTDDAAQNMEIKSCPYMVFDCESIGLHGETYAVGYVVIVGGREVEADMFACPGGMAEGVDSDRLWVYENIPPLKSNSPDAFTVREKFWRRWQEWKAKGALLAADCAWPVEARFLAACVDALPDERRFTGPYPLVEISMWMMAAGQDPMTTHARLETELPHHNPLADARQSARLLLEATKSPNASGPTKRSAMRPTERHDLSETRWAHSLHRLIRRANSWLTRRKKRKPKVWLVRVRCAFVNLWLRFQRMPRTEQTLQWVERNHARIINVTPPWRARWHA